MAKAQISLSLARARCVTATVPGCKLLILRCRLMPKFKDVLRRTTRSARTSTLLKFTDQGYKTERGGGEGGNSDIARDRYAITRAYARYAYNATEFTISP